MNKAQAWIQAARLRTLPLSISGILISGGMALRVEAFDWAIFMLALSTTIGFQVLSNFANDYGDGVKGTDNEDRVGPARAMQSGALTAESLKNGIVFMSILTLALSVYLIYVAFGSEQLQVSLLYLFLGLSAIIAAIKYTVGKSAYGYRGLGDLFVFIFFGLVGVVGGYFLFTQQVRFIHFLPGISIGLFSTVVLHLNNMRDRLSDEKVNKRTLAVILGSEGSVGYHNALLGFAIVSWVLYLLLSNAKPLLFVSCLAFLPLLFHFLKVIKIKDHRMLDPQLKVVALSTFFLSFLFFTLLYL